MNEEQEKKIVFISPDFPPQKGGIQTSAYELAKNLSKKVNLTVYTLKENLPADNRNFKVKNIMPNKYFLSLIPIIKELKNDKPDLIHIYNAGYSSLVSIIKFILKIPYLVTIHGKDFLSPFAGPVFKKTNAYLGCLFADKIQVGSQGIKNKIQIKFKNRDIRIIPYGINLEVFRVLKKNELNLKNPLFLNKKIILSVGRIEARKGFDTVLMCLPSLIQEIPNLLYIIVGDGPYKNKIIKLANDLGLEKYLYLAGRVSDQELIEYYNLADLFIMLPREINGDIEGFGLVYLEANACGLPVIGSCSGGVPDAVINGKTGVLVNAESKSELALTIKEVLNDETLRNSLIRNGLKHTQENSWEKTADKTNDLYKEILKDKDV